MPEGIVLTRTPLREYDEVISFITRDFGRVDVLAKSVKKITSKLSPHLESFSHVSFDSVQGKEMAILTTVTAIEFFPHIRTHYIKSLQAEFASHALHRLTRPGNLEYGVFDLFSEWLQMFDSVTDVSDCRFLDWFMLKLMSAIGFEPTYSACVRCGRTDNLSFWSFSGGGVVCTGCFTNNFEGDALVRVSSQTIQDLSRLSLEDPRKLGEGTPFAPGVHSLLVGHLQYQTEAKIGNWAHTCLQEEVASGKLA